MEMKENAAKAMLPNKKGIMKIRAMIPPKKTNKPIIKARFSKNPPQELIIIFNRNNIKMAAATPIKTNVFSKAFIISFEAIEISNNGKASSANILILSIFRTGEIFDGILYTPSTRIWQIHILLSLHTYRPV